MAGNDSVNMQDVGQNEGERKKKKRRKSKREEGA